MVPFHVMAGRNSMVCNSRGVTYLCKSFEMLGLPIMQSSFCLTDVEGIAVPTTGFIYYFRPLRKTETIFVRKKRLNPAGVLKNNPRISTAIKLTDTRFNTSSKSFTLQAKIRQDKKDIFPRNSGGRFSRPVLLSVLPVCRDGAVVRALASHQCGPGSISRLGVICGLSLLVLYSAPRGFLRVLRFPLSSKTKS